MKKLGAGLLVALVGGVPLAWWKWGHRDVAELSLTCTPGQSRAYALSYESRGQVSDPTFGLSQTDAPEGQSVETVVKGRWRETCVRGDATGHVLEVAVEEAKGQFTSKGALGSGPAPKDVSELVTGTSYVELGADGKVRSIHFDPRMSPLGQNLVRDMLSLRSMHLGPPVGDGASWTSDEEDFNGRYSAPYTLEFPEEGLARVTKGSRTYAATGASKLTKVAPLVRALPSTHGEWVLELDTHQPRSVRSHVEVELVASSRVIGRSQSHLELTPPSRPSRPRWTRGNCRSPSRPVPRGACGREISPRATRMRASRSASSARSWEATPGPRCWRRRAGPTRIAPGSSSSSRRSSCCIRRPAGTRAPCSPCPPVPMRRPSSSWRAPWCPPVRPRPSTPWWPPSMPRATGRPTSAR
ncbi:hypothetical protein ACN28S_55595 [Cystobacter fuscus]